MALRHVCGEHIASSNQSFDQLTNHRAIGGRAGQFPDVETAKKVQVDFTLAAANAFAAKLLPALDEAKDFKFVFCSGGMASRDQETSLWILQDTRKLKVKPFLKVNVAHTHITRASPKMD